MQKGKTKSIIITVVLVIVLIICMSCIRYNQVDHSALVIQLGKVVDVKNDEGLYFTAPFIQKTKIIYTGEHLYDLPETEVITSDKKTMIANCYVTWQITDPKLYYSSLSSESVAQGRIDVAVYNAMKNLISSETQDAVISGKDGSLGENILGKITSLSQYGIAITEVEMKVLDLPEDNKASVYNRMISEREVIAAEYTANGEKEAAIIRNETDAQVRKTVSEAEVEAANIEASAEMEYYSTLADAYGKSKDRQEFYEFMIGIDTLKEALQNGGTMVIDESSPLYDILINAGEETEVTESYNEIIG